MALFKSQVLTQASGSVGGLTYSHANGGMYMRARSIPVQPNTTFQQQVKAALTALVNRWTEFLTDAQRTAWNLYAANVPVTNALGDTITLSGQNWYIATNTPREQASSKLGVVMAGTVTDPFVDEAPVTFNRGDFTTPTIVADVSAGVIITFTAADFWNSTSAGGMLIYQGRPQNAARNFYNGPWRLIEAIATGPAVSPVTVTPANIALRGYTYSTDQRVSFAVAVSQSDARLSTRRQQTVIAIA